MDRRWVLKSAAAAAFSGAFSARGQDYPNRPVRVIVPFPAGGPVDVVARILSARFGESLGQPVIVENRPGAAGTIGTEAVARAVPDGYTLLLSGMDLAINPGLFDSLRYDVLRDLSAIGIVGSAPMLLVAPASAGLGSVPQLLEFLRQQGANAATPVITGAPPHLATELFLRKHGLTATRVPYKGAAPAVIDLAAGRLAFMLVGLSASRSFIESGKLRPVAVTGVRRAAMLPDVPTFREAGVPMPELDNGSWWGVMAPKDVPLPVFDRIGAALVAALAQADVRSRLAAIDVSIADSSPAAFSDLLRSEQRKWTTIAKAAGIRPE
jgi:tripartite-type tricarboxylate transporter receptor subunit TctC